MNEEKKNMKKDEFDCYCEIFFFQTIAFIYILKICKHMILPNTLSKYSDKDQLQCLLDNDLRAINSTQLILALSESSNNNFE